MRLGSIADKLCPIIDELEPRIVPAAVCDLTPGLIEGPGTAVPGERLQMGIQVSNLGAVSSPRFQVEIRLSLDGVIDDQDPVLATINRRKVRAAGTVLWTQRFKLPDNLPAGVYHFGVVVDPANRIAEGNEANNTGIAGDTTPIYRTALDGRVKSLQKSKPVSIHALGDTGAPLDLNATTWLIIHGRNESSMSPDLVTLGQQIDQYQPGDQVLVLDWQKAAFSGALGGQGENYILPVAAWAAQTLTEYGFAGSQLNLVGYSWGAEVAEEMSEILGHVNSIVAIDPARDYPGGSYNPEAPGEINLQAHASHSWAFFASASLPFGSPIVATTAENAIVLTGSDHFGVVSVVTSLLALPVDSPIAAAFSIAGLLTGLPIPNWPSDSYSSIGDLDISSGTFEAVVLADATGKSISSLRYFDGAVEQTISV
jgi:pimeloyl-ACP methyl ester carboxylesterase